MTSKIGETRPALWKYPCLWAALCLLFGLLASVKIARYEASHRLNDAKSLVTHDLATVRARLESVVGSVFSSTSGVVSVVGHQGDISPELFNSMAAQAIKIHPQIRNIALAPGNTISKVYPLAGNERVLGVNYASIPEQYRTVQQAMDSGQPVLDGPVRLIQGGDGFILRSPVFTHADPTKNSSGRYWGMVSIVSEVSSMLDASGIRSATELRIALRKSPEKGSSSDMIWGDASIFSLSPVSMPISVPGGEWQIAAIRAEGWPALTVTEYPIFYFGLLNSLLLAGLVWLLASRHRQVDRENQRLLREIGERAKTELLLQLSNRKYQNILDMMPDMIGITRMSDGLILETNAGFERCTGWSIQEATGRTSIELGLWSQETRAEALEILMRTGKLENFEFEMGTKLGQKRPAIMYLTTIELDGVACLYFMVHDITPLKQAQLILEGERSRLRILLQTIPALVWMKDPDGVYLACNNRFERLFGASEADIIGRSDYDFVVKELADFFREHDLKAIAAGGPSVNEEWVTYADDGHRELLETIKTPVHKADGTLIGVLGIARDITEQRRIEEELRNERLRFRNLVDSVDGIVWEADAETFLFTYVSRQAERLLGYPVEEWYQPNFWEEHLHPDDRTWALTYCANSTAKMEDHDFEYRFITRDGSEVWLHDIVTVVEENGRPRWLRGIMVDMTASKQKETEKQRLEAQLRQAQKMEAIGRLAGGIAHDFNNKLAVILGYAEMAQRAGISAERHGTYLGQVIKAAELSREITRQLLAFSRQEVITPRVIDLNDLIRDSRAGLCRFIGEDIRFELNLAERLWPISMDPTQVDQIIMNLVVNARDAMSDVGLLTIATDCVSLDGSFTITNPDFRPGDYVMMTVSDSGSGMDNETLQHIFEPFFTTKESGKGTGLGLATIYGIVTQNNGFINVYSEPGIGTTFRIYFPRCYEPESAEATESPEPRLEKNATILLVEDDETVRELVDEILTEIGYTIVAAKSPLEAVEMCATGGIRPDLLLTDVIMPEMNGRELAQQIRACQPGIRTLFMSGYTSDIIGQKGILGEGLHFITKPFDRISLHNRIQDVLGEEQQPCP